MSGNSLDRSRDDIRIRPARPSELDELSALAFRAKSHWGYPVEWLAEWRPQVTLSPEDLDALVVHVATRGGQAVGFYALAAGRFASLEHLWVDPASIGTGVGRALLSDALEEARLHGHAVVQIDSDPHAEGFYIRMGAVRVGLVSAPVAGNSRQLPRLNLLCQSEG